MRFQVAHHTYGEVVYEESAWSGRCKLFFNGEAQEQVGKRRFLTKEGKRITVHGNLLFGVTLEAWDARIEVVPGFCKVEVWMLAAFFGMAFLAANILIGIWGSVPHLKMPIAATLAGCTGLFGSILGWFDVMAMRKAAASREKVCKGLCFAAAFFGICFLCGMVTAWLLGS